MSELFAVKVNRDDTVQVLSIAVTKETPYYYYITDIKDSNDPRRGLWGWGTRVEKSVAMLSARAALEVYMARRQRDKANAKAVIAQATKQIASANELLMHCQSDPGPQTPEGVRADRSTTTI